MNHETSVSSYKHADEYFNSNLPWNLGVYGRTGYSEQE